MSSKSSSSEHKIEVTKVLAHELTHQWFGNSVTMRKWNDLWLKEGFATYFSYKCLNDIVPEWRLMDLFPFFEQRPAMNKDSDRFSHPISFDVNSASDIRRIFDPISYSKGASIIRMANSFLGEEAFQDGIVNYLTRFQYDNAVSNDLWQILTESGHKYESLPLELNLENVMDTYTRQPGYPVLEVKRDPESREIILTQRRFMLPATSNDSLKWYIPITYRTKYSQFASSLWFSATEDAVKLPALDNDKTDWIQFNINRTGYYRVNYETKLWEKFIYNFGEIDHLTRAQLIDDVFALSRAELIEYDVPLSFLIVMGMNPNDAFSWAAAESGLNYLTTMVRREPAYELFRLLMASIFKPMYANIQGFNESDGETDLQVMHKARMLKLICDFKVDLCTRGAQLKFRDWMTQKENK